MPDSRRVEPLQRPPDVTIEVPGSKSHTNRAVLCAALAPGLSRLRRVLLADDTEAMLAAISALGVSVRIEADDGSGVVEIDGGVADQRAVTAGEPRRLDVRQSGTTSRFLLPVLAATPGRFVLDGDPQLRSRPFGPQLGALRSLGADITGDGLPLDITGRQLHGAVVDVAADISSQFLSGLLLAAPLLAGTTTIVVGGELVSRPYVELTMATMAAFGVGAEVGSRGDGQSFTVSGGSYTPAEVELEPDASAASYFFAAAAITGGRVRVEGLGSKTVQGDIRFVEVLERMGARVASGPDWTEVEGVGPLRGITVDMADISDTAQTLAVVACFADSPTVIGGIGFIRYKETDRIAAVVTELGRLGIHARATADGMVIEPGPVQPGPVATYGDHRMAMSFSLLGLRVPGIEVEDPGCVAKTFPRFFDVLDQLR